MSSKYDDDDRRHGGKYDDDDDKSTSESEGDVSDMPDEIPAGVRGGRRQTVMSAPITVDQDWEPPVFPKSDAERSILNESITANVLFSSLGEKELEVIVNAMQRRCFESGDRIIRQGDDGDMFYVVEEGICDIFVEGAGKVMEIEGGVRSSRNFFGELALLYDAPRAATVTASSDVVAWGLDRVTFKTILQDVTQKQRSLYRTFLEQVPILEPLNMYEKLTLADAMVQRSYREGEVIISEGKTGDEFYIVEDGEVKCTKSMDGETVEVSDRLSCGDFFGELALLNDDTRKATVTATRDSKVLVIDRQTFKRLLGPLESLLKQQMELYDQYVYHK